jgi:broad specificity phosphatase PhoE
MFLHNENRSVALAFQVSEPCDLVLVCALGNEAWAAHRKRVEAGWKELIAEDSAGRIMLLRHGYRAFGFI